MTLVFGQSTGQAAGRRLSIGRTPRLLSGIDAKKHRMPGNKSRVKRCFSRQISV
ncbi:MAG: hypothetical protein HFG47_03605 [Lachnospiraceae bacterium]|nr:hypothetical protein [Lachnospiraceae bacterium]